MSHARHQRETLWPYFLADTHYSSESSLRSSQARERVVESARGSLRDVPPISTGHIPAVEIDSLPSRGFATVHYGPLTW